ncbi:MAG TPA: thiolase family protein [Acidimicrobiales bacterium]|nr:thiolase family protein [Acidimicrobiales bacterium]
MTPTRAYILDAVRTPIGKYHGGLAGVRPDDLAATVVRAVADRVPEVDPARIDDVWLGDANGAGEDSRDVARMAVLLAGLPVTVTGTTVNRLCGSGMEAVAQASRAVLLGDARVAVAGGVESMSRAPWVTLDPAAGEPVATALGWRLVNPRMPPGWTISLGEGAEVLAEKYGIDREAQDAFALDSHRKAAEAWDAGRFAEEVVAVPGSPLVTDESVRRDTSLEALARLRPVFREEGGTVTAGNASPLADGAAALLLADEEVVAETGRRPLARIVSRATSGVEPHLYGIGPVEAARKALAGAGIGWSDLVAVEVNEAFSAQVLACLAEWPQLDRALVNPNGGAIALGHPLGCSGARIVGTLAHELRRRGGGYGLAAMCVGVGQGIATVLEGA